MNKIAKILFSLIRYEVFGKEYGRDTAELSDPDTLGAVCTLAAFHDMAHLVADALGRLSVVTSDEKLANALGREQLKAIFRAERTDNELRAVSELFEKEKIEFLPLKGAIIRELYPEKWMRTSCDIDILVKKDDLGRASEALENSLEYKKMAEGDHDVGFMSPSGLHFELHFELIDNGRGLKIFDSVWEHTYAKAEGEFHRYMTDEFFYLFHMVHMAKHVENGGCGIKPLLDLAFLNKADSLVKKEGYGKFADAACRLADCWFGKGEKDALCEELEKYILRAGVYGNVNNAVAVGQVKKGGKASYIFSRIFLPYDKLKYRYPTLAKHKCLLPFYQVVRWFGLLSDGGVKRSANEIKVNSEMPNESGQAVGMLLSELGLTK